MSNNNITNGITLECEVFYEAIGVEKDLILVNYSDFDFEQTSLISNRQTDELLENNRGLTNIFLKEGAIKYIFEGTDYSVVPSVNPEVREDGKLWYSHSINFTVYSKKSQDRETLLSLGGSTVIGITKDRSTGLYELFGMYQGLKVNEISRTYTGSQSSNFYQVTIATPEINVVKEPSLSELSVYLDDDIILPPEPTPGIYGDATPTTLGLVRVDSIQASPIVYLKSTIDTLFARISNILTTEILLESNKNSTTKWPSAKSVVDWIVNRFEQKIATSDISKYYRGDKTWQTLNAETIGLEKVDNTSDLEKPISEMVSLAFEGKADLIGGKVPIEQLPSYIDEVKNGYFSGGVFYEDIALTIPINESESIIYIDLTSGQNSAQYRWSGLSYIQMTNGFIASTNNVPEGNLNLYHTAARVLETVLNGITFTVATVVNNSDTIRTAIGKLQAQINNINNQTNLNHEIYDEVLLSVKQEFPLPEGAVCLFVYINGAVQYKETLNNTLLTNTWTQVGDNIILLENTEINNYIHIIYRI